MRYVRLGKTELEVSEIAFGTWAFGGDWGSFDAHESGAAIHHALDLGVTFFDTAQAYGFSRRTTCSAATSRGRSCPTQPSTTSVCSSTARSPTDCSRGA